MRTVRIKPENRNAVSFKTSKGFKAFYHYQHHLKYFWKTNAREWEYLSEMNTQLYLVTQKEFSDLELEIGTRIKDNFK